VARPITDILQESDDVQHKILAIMLDIQTESKKQTALLQAIASSLGATDVASLVLTLDKAVPQ
jgi:hypothetical protein